MADLSTLSDDELRKIYAKAKDRGVTVNQAAKPRSVADMSDDELRAAAASAAPSSTLDDFARATYNGLTLNYGDEISAGVNSALRSILPESMMDTGAKTYDARLAQERAENAKLAKDRPVLNAAGNVLGATVPGLALAPFSGGASLAGTVARGAGLGALEGGVAGFGSGEGVNNRVQNAVTGGAVGGAVGAAAPAIAAGVGSVWQRLRPLVNPEGSAARNLGQTLEESGIDPGRAAMSVADNPDPTALPIDMLPKPIQRRAEYIVTKNPDAAQMIEDRLLDRQRGAYQRLNQSLDNPNGPNINAPQLDAGLQSELKRFGKEVFDPAVSRPVDQDIAQMAWDRALSSPALSRIANSDAYKQSLAEDFRVRSLEDIPLMDRLHRLQWFAREAAENMGNPLNPGGKSNYMAGQISRRRDTLNDQIGTFNPAFKQAQAGYAERIGHSDALKAADNFRSMPAEDFDRLWSDLSPAEQATYRVGAASQLRTWLGSRAGEVVDYARPLGSPEMRHKLQTVFGDDLDSVVRRESKYVQTYNDTLRGSQTARRLAAADDDEPSLVGGAAFDLATGSPGVGVVTQIARKGLKSIGDIGRGQQMKAEADAITSQYAFARLMQQFRRERQMQEIAARIGNQLTPAAGVAIGNQVNRR